MDPEPTAAAIRPRCYNLSFDARGRAALAEQCYPQALDLSWKRIQTENSEIWHEILGYFNYFLLQMENDENAHRWSNNETKQAQSVAESRIASDSTRQRADLGRLKTPDHWMFKGCSRDSFYHPLLSLPLMLRMTFALVFYNLLHHEMIRNEHGGFFIPIPSARLHHLHRNFCLYSSRSIQGAPLCLVWCMRCSIKVLTRPKHSAITQYYTVVIFWLGTIGCFLDR